MAQAPSSGWTDRLPFMRGRTVAVREVSVDDAAPLHLALKAYRLPGLMATPPATVEDMEAFIRWSSDERAKGRSMCFAIVPSGCEDAAGVVQVRILDGVTAEWGFAVGTTHWGTGIFEESAHLVLAFLFTDTAILRVEARVTTDNVRANGAMRKLGFVADAALRGALRRDGVALDQNLWAMTREDWRATIGDGTWTM